MTTVTIVVEDAESGLRIGADQHVLGFQYDNRAQTFSFKRGEGLETAHLSLIFRTSRHALEFQPISIGTANQFVLTSLLTQGERLDLQLLLQRDGQEIRSNIIQFQFAESLQAVKPPPLEIPAIPAPMNPSELISTDDSNLLKLGSDKLLLVTAATPEAPAETEGATEREESGEVEQAILPGLSRASVLSSTEETPTASTSDFSTGEELSYLWQALSDEKSQRKEGDNLLADSIEQLGKDRQLAQQEIKGVVDSLETIIPAEVQKVMTQSVTSVPNVWLPVRTEEILDKATPCQEVNLKTGIIRQCRDYAKRLQYCLTIAGGIRIARGEFISVLLDSSFSIAEGRRYMGLAEGSYLSFYHENFEQALTIGLDGLVLGASKTLATATVLAFDDGLKLYLEDTHDDASVNWVIHVLYHQNEFVLTTTHDLAGDSGAEVIISKGMLSPGQPKLGDWVENPSNGKGGFISMLALDNSTVTIILA